MIFGVRTRTRPRRGRAQRHTGQRLSLEENRTSGNPDVRQPGIESLASPAPGIKLWWCSIEPSAEAVATFERCLSEPERARALRFGTQVLRERYVMGRGSLRTILGRELGFDAATVDIVRGTRGRPQLAGAPALDFTVSHTAGSAIIGHARRGRIGVDIERLDRTINTDGIARKFMTDSERAAMSRDDRDAMRQQVLTLWTCKEAMSKATGDALTAPFGAIDVSLRPARAVRGGPGPYAPAGWTLHAIDVLPPFVATVALWTPTTA